MALLLVHACLAWFARLPGILTGQDDAQYLLLARSLRHFGYHDIFQVGAPAHRLYPPGYPGFLAVWTTVVGERINLLVGANILLSVTALALTYVLVKRLWSGWIALHAVG